MSYLGQIQNLDWASPSRKFATTVELFNSQPNYEHEVAIALDTGIKYQGSAPIVGGWAFATGVPIVPPAVAPAVNDAFTKVLLEFDGKEGSTTYPDTNVANWPHTWTTIGLEGFGSTTNIGEKFPLGALRLDGKTLLIAADEKRFDFRDSNFSIRGWFLAEMPMGDYRTLIGKAGNTEPVLFVFWCDRTDQGFFNVGFDTSQVVDHFLLDRFGNQIFDRQNEFVITRFAAITHMFHILESTTAYTDVDNPGWHSFLVRRTGPLLELLMDGVVEDSNSIGLEVINRLHDPLTIGGYGPPRDGGYLEGSSPWIGMVDRLAIDIGIAR